MRSTPPASPGLLVGQVMHHRLRPRRHRFHYKIFSILLDIDRIEPDLAGLRLARHNGWAPLSFHDRDHGARDGTPLRPWVEAVLNANGLPAAHGRILLACFPRVFGYVFNPISLYFVHDEDGRLVAMIYEVRNTFGGSRAYAARVDVAEPGRPAIHACFKDFYVSPFVGPDARYGFRVQLHQGGLSFLIRERDAEGDLLLATHNARLEPLTDRSVLRCLVTRPFLTLSVMAAIHWQALKLWWKGVPMHRMLNPADAAPRPPSPTPAVDPGLVS